MSSLVLDLRSNEDTRDIIHRAVQALAEGKIVGFPTETVYVLGASALNPTAVSRLHELVQASNTSNCSRLSLAVKSADEALDYVPDMSPLGKPLARRCWPGPVTLVVQNHHPDSLMDQIPSSVREFLSPSHFVGLRAPTHPALREVLKLTVGPVVLADCPKGEAQQAVTAAEVVEGFDQSVALLLDDGQTRFRQPASVVQVVDGRYDVVQVGVVSKQILKRLSSMIVLFVCTGNTCRSPMAEAIMRKLVAEKLGCQPDEVDERGVQVVSAGLAASMGAPASREAVKVLGEAGLNLDAHESQPVTENLIRHADLILTMTRSHRHAILAEWPNTAERVKLLCHSGADVSDPVGGPVEVYRACAAQIRKELEQWLGEIQWEV